MSESGRKGLVALALAALTAAVFWSAAGNDFAFDDKVFMLTERRALGGLTRDGLAWALTSTDIALYSPLARLSALVDLQLYGTRPFGHHVTSLLLHGAASLLIFLALAELTGALWKSAAVGALAAAHPLRVEPVAWVSGRADLLAALFGLLALYAWIRYLRRRGPGWLALALGAFLLGMLGKIIVVTLPFVLLLLDFWPLGRTGLAGPGGDGAARGPGGGRAGAIAALLREKAGLLLIAAALTGVAFAILQRSTLVYAVKDYPLSARVGTSLVSYATYVGKTLWPAELTVFYPHRWSVYGAAEVGGSLLLLAAVSAAAVATARRLPHLLVGWLWFLGMLLPVIGLYQARDYPIADRYLYLPQIGLFVMALWSIEAAGSGRGRAPATAAVVALILVCVPASRAQVRHWKDDLSLFAHAVAVAPDAELARYNYGSNLAAGGRYAEAVEQLAEAVRLAPAHVEARYNYGNSLAGAGRLAEAIVQLREVVRLAPRYADAHYNLGRNLADAGRYAEALEHLETYLALEPRPPDRAFIDALTAMLRQRAARPSGRLGTPRADGRE